MVSVRLIWPPLAPLPAEWACVGLVATIMCYIKGCGSTYLVLSVSATPSVAGGVACVGLVATRLRGGAGSAAIGMHTMRA